MVHLPSVESLGVWGLYVMIMGETSFDDTLFEDKQLLEFIQSLSRQNVKNLALINCFFINSKRLMKVIYLVKI